MQMVKIKILDDKFWITMNNNKGFLSEGLYFTILIWRSIKERLKWKKDK